MMNRVLAVGVLALAVSLSYYWTYSNGKDAGAKKVYGEWAQHELVRGEAINKLRGELDVLVAQHKKAQEDYESQLAAATAQYEADLSGYRDEYDRRLQLADQRTGVYQRKARGSEAEREDLARHAAELDRSLEEGRVLVRELGATVRQREVTIRALGGIILNDRTLLESK